MSPSAPPPSVLPAAPAPAGDLFDQQREDWRHDPRAAFDAWLASQAYRHSSADVYRAQWGRFLDWLTLRRKTLVTVDSATIAEFADSLSARRPQRQRYLRLIERVLDHVRDIELASTNPARFIAQDGEAAWRRARDNEPTGFLDAAGRTRLIAWLAAPLSARDASAPHWRVARDRALVALFLGAGLKTREAAALELEHIAPENDWITVEAANSAFTRVTPVAPFAADLLAAWRIEHRRATPASQRVFPATSAGRAMHKATMLRAVDALIEAAGLAGPDEARISPQTLRNSFAAEQFERGIAPEQVGRWLGFAQEVSARRLHRAWQRWMEGRPTDENVAVGPGDNAAPPESDRLLLP